MKVDVLSLFPDYFKGPFDVSIVKRAIDKGILSINHVNIRDFSKDKHKRVDDRPFGGGSGMVMGPQPIFEAVKSVRADNSHVVCLSAQGNVLNAKKCEELSKKEHLVLLCGHYEGIDERVIEKQVDEEISIGDYVLTNGCIAAIVLIDAVLRYIPGALGNSEAVLYESHQMGFLEGPQYTRPEEYEGMRVPEILLNGHHEKIKKWRLKEGLEKTKKMRPDLYKNYEQGVLSETE
jgi:tRNA (guanine37-N1)-methyltransferase